MAAPQIVSLPPFFTLASGMIVRVTAVDPATNATVAGVSISGVSIDVDTPDPTPPPLELAFSPAFSQGGVSV